jgi:hypothetical protein
MDLWEKAIAKLNLKSPKDQTIKSFYSNCIKLLVGFEDITDKVKFDLFKLIPYVPYAYNSPVLIEILWKFRAKGYARKYIPDIYLEMLKHFMPDFDKEKIKETISDLYIDADQLGTKNTLHQICNQFAERGDSFLEELYEKYK